jgi:hypothetical protein
MSDKMEYSYLLLDAVFTQAEAEEILECLYARLAQYEQVPVSDLCLLVGMSPTYRDEKWGWTDLSEAKTEKADAGYLVRLPQPKPIN